MKEKVMYNIDFNLKSEVVTWNKYQETIDKLCNQVVHKYDFILGIFQGGYIVALSMADKIVNCSVGGIVSKETHKTGQIILPNFEGNVSKIVQGKRILLVDEVIDSGYSISLCKKMLMYLNPEYVHVACLYLNVTSDELVEYYVERFNGETNYIFPWRYNRDFGSLLVDAMKRNHYYDVEELQNLCYSTFGINIKCNIIFKVLKNSTMFEKTGNRWRLRNE